MLTRVQLAEVSRRDGVPIHTVERDYVQHLLLRQITDETLSFKGGTCLRIVHGSPRYSGDLDFSGTAIRGHTEGVFALCAKRLAAYGVSADLSIRDSPAASLLGRVRYEGPLFDGSARTRGSIRIEASLRTEDFQSEQRFVPRTPYADVPQLVLRVLTAEELFAEKTRALIVRKKARDLYDVHFLLQREVSSPLSLLHKKMKLYDRKFGLREVESAVRTAGRSWKRDLEPLVGQVPPYDELARRVRQFFRSRYLK